ncbi:MAG: hypothetical protein R3A10_06290 [Caldilineaceae bacterium]
MALPAAVLWPLRELDAALDQLARHSGLLMHLSTGPFPARRHCRPRCRRRMTRP